MGCQSPETIMLATESLDSCAFGHIPDTDAFVFGDRNNQLLSLVKNCTGYVVGVSTASVYFPCLGFYKVKDPCWVRGSIIDFQPISKAAVLIRAIYHSCARV